MNRKLVIFDVDGTIIEGRTLPEEAVRAIGRVRANGHRAVFFTGRPYLHVDPRVRAIGFDGCICTMGAYIRIGDRVLQDRKPNPADAHRVVELVRRAGLDCAFEASDGIAFDLTRPLPPFLAGLKAHFDQIGFDTGRDIDAPGASFDKLCLWSNEHSSFDGVEEALSPYLTRIGKKENMEEWVARGVSVPESVGRVMAHFGASRADTLAIGDSVNDLPMLRCAGYTMAMGQAPQALREQVDFVTAPVLEGGLAAAMAHCGLL